METQLQMRSVPPVTKEFIDRLKAAFPNRIPSIDATLAQVQRIAGQQEVIEFAINFARNYDPTNTALRDRQSQTTT